MKSEFYKTLNGDQLLNFSSTLWWHCNERKKKEEPHTLFIQLEEIPEYDTFRTDLDCLFKQCISWKRNYRKQYKSIQIEKISLHLGRGDYENTWYLVGERLETQDELTHRLNLINQEEQFKLKEKKEKEQKKEEAELKEFLKLKEKFEKKG